MTEQDDFGQDNLWNPCFHVPRISLCGSSHDILGFAREWGNANVSIEGVLVIQGLWFDVDEKKTDSSKTKSSDDEDRKDDKDKVRLENKCLC